MVEPVRHRQTKEAATDMFHLKPPRHISTLPKIPLPGGGRECPVFPGADVHRAAADVRQEWTLTGISDHKRRIVVAWSCSGGADERARPRLGQMCMAARAVSWVTLSGRRYRSREFRLRRAHHEQGLGALACHLWLSAHHYVQVDPWDAALTREETARENG